MVKKKGFFIRGVPISSKLKVTFVLLLFLIFILNTIIPVFFESLNYTGKNVVSIIILGLFVVISIGSKSAEAIVIGVAMVALISNLWDLGIYDISEFRKQVLIGSIGILTVALVFGEIGIINLIHIFKKQVGAEK